MRFRQLVQLCISNAQLQGKDRFLSRHWRTPAGVEVDLVVESGGKLIPVEVKLSATPRPGMAAAITSFREDLGVKAAPGFVIHPGDIRLPLAPKTLSIPFSEF
jgi:Holliday junction resolvase-like predicted endonuclease